MYPHLHQIVLSTDGITNIITLPVQVARIIHRPLTVMTRAALTTTQGEKVRELQEKILVVETKKKLRREEVDDRKEKGGREMKERTIQIQPAVVEVKLKNVNLESH